LQEIKVSIDLWAPLAMVAEWGSTDIIYRRVTFEALPDDVLLEIFYFYIDEVQDLDAWHPLVHVCRRWRHVVFASPRRLNVQLYCSFKRPTRKMLDVWPPLPIVIANINDGMMNDGDPTSPEPEDPDNVIAALEYSDRVYGIYLGAVQGCLLERVVAVMEGPFPSLESLELSSDNDGPAPVIPSSFLSGSAPHLQSLLLSHVQFTAFRRLPLLASNLVHLRLWDIPGHRYTPPRVIINCLVALTALQSFDLEFSSPPSPPYRLSRHPPSLTRVVLPALTSWHFKGVSEYLEDIVARIEVPLLNDFAVTFFNQLIFNNPQTLQFISRTERIKASNRATVILSLDNIVIKFSQKTETVNHTGLEIVISSTQTDWQLSSLAQICVWSLPHLSTLERLDICDDRRSSPDWQDDMENDQWLELVQPFTAVKDLHLSKDVAQRVALALQELTGERVAEMLPVLQNLFLEEIQTSGPVHEAAGKFVAARQLNDHPVALQNWERREGFDD
jgi:hypothetical protein